MVQVRGAAISAEKPKAPSTHPPHPPRPRETRRCSEVERYTLSSVSCVCPWLFLVGHVCYTSSWRHPNQIPVPP